MYANVWVKHVAMQDWNLFLCSQRKISFLSDGDLIEPALLQTIKQNLINETTELNKTRMSSHFVNRFSLLQKDTKQNSDKHAFDFSMQYSPLLHYVMTFEVSDFSEYGQHTREMFRPFHVSVSRSLCQNAKSQSKSVCPFDDNYLWGSFHHFFHSWHVSFWR